MKGIIIIFLASVLFIPACKVTCENVKVGETTLAAETQQFLIYNEGEEVSFTDQNNNSVSFTVRKEESVYFICQKITCDPLDPYKSSYCEYIEAPQVNLYLNNDSTLLAIEASVFAYEPKTDLLYDAVRFTISHENSSIFASHITDVKFNDPRFERDEINDIDEFMVEKDEITLRNKTYKDVLLCEGEELSLYCNKGTGVIAFRIKDRLFVRDN